MSNASQRNFAAAVGERDRRQARINEGEDPIGLAQAAYLGPGWDAFFGSLHDQADAAHAAGMGYQVSLGGIGRGADEGAGGGGLNPLELDSLKNQGLSQNFDAVVQQARAQKLHQDAITDAQEQERINDLHRSYAEQSQASALAPPLEPTAVSISPNGEKLTAKPAGTPTEQMLARMSPPARMKAQAEMLAASLKQREVANAEAKTAETVRKDKAAESVKSDHPDVSGDVRTTFTGKKYIDLGDYQTPTEKSKAAAAAKALGVPVVKADVGSSLQAADTARQNINAMWSQIESKLPKDPTGRVLGGPENKIAKFMQTDSDIAAFNSWRAGAIQAVQALVEKGMGFRLNQAEINMIMQNDMPQITDTVGTARKRVDNVLTLLQNKENSALTLDRSSLAGGGDVGSSSAKKRIRYDANGNPIKD